MFGFLKKGFKDVVDKFSKEVEEESKKTTDTEVKAEVTKIEAPKKEIVTTIEKTFPSPSPTLSPSPQTTKYLSSHSQPS